MSHSWKCVLCGTSILSKCPGHRSEFYGFEQSIARSVVTINRVDDEHRSFSELFVSYTADAKLTTAEQFWNLAELLTKDQMIESMTCDHVWVLNSEDNHICTLDHEHPNLNDAERVKADYLARQPERKIENVISEFASVANISVELARKAVNLTKPKFDHLIEEEFQQMKNYVRYGMDKLVKGQAARPEFRIHTAGNRWGNECHYAYFSREEDAVDFVRGANRGLSVEKLDAEGQYKDHPVEINTTCIHCGKLNLPESEIIIRTDKGDAHLTCVNRHKKAQEVKLRRGRIPYRGRLELDYSRLQALKRYFGLEDLDSYVDDDRHTTVIYLSKISNAADFEDIKDQVRRELF